MSLQPPEGKQPEKAETFFERERQNAAQITERKSFFRRNGTNYEEQAGSGPALSLLRKRLVPDE